VTYYKDLRKYIQALEKAGQLVRIKRLINKDTELHSLVRLQYRGLSEEQRKAFLFENVIDSKGNRYDIPVVVGALAGSSKIYSIGMMCKPEEINEKFAQSLSMPIPPKIVKSGPVQEEIFMGSNLLERGGLGEFPIPISTPGYDCAPYMSAPFWITKDPDTGIRNVGTYRAQLKGPTRCGIYFGFDFQGGFIHWKKCKERRIPLEAAIVIGGPPSIGYVSVSRLPIDVDELGVAGAIAKEPLELVKCKKIDLEVPAHAEIVIEGKINTEEIEPEAPFGESLGFIGLETIMPYFTVECITHRRNPMWLSFISQYPPSESSKIRQHANEASLLQYLRDELKMSFVSSVSCGEPVGSNRYWVIKMKKAEIEDIWQALETTGQRFPRAKVIIAVDEDINPYDFDSVNWAICHRVQPHRDCRIVNCNSIDPMECSIVPMDERFKLRDVSHLEMPESSQLLIDTTMKWSYPPISLPKKAFMDRAMEIWKEEGLPELRLKEPIWGHNLGYWSDADMQKAKWATEGDYHKTAQVQTKGRRSA